MGEVVLACALVRDNGWRSLTPNDHRVVELSELLQLYTEHPIEERGPDFRNPNGVARKTADIATQHPNYAGKPTNGGRHDPGSRRVWIAWHRMGSHRHRSSSTLFFLGRFRVGCSGLGAVWTVIGGAGDAGCAFTCCEP
jgi:hypothetical protein